MTCQEVPGFCREEPDRRHVLFISHTDVDPLVFCHSMSAMASLLKSPVPIACQLEPGLKPATPPPVKFNPSTNQITGVPSSFCQRISDLPSPLKSPAAFTCQAVPGFDPTAPPAIKSVPFINQMAAWP